MARLVSFSFCSSICNFCERTFDALCRQYSSLLDGTISHVSKVDVSGNFPSAFAHPYDERMLLRARQFLLFDSVRNAVLTN